jgi:hypothetical protein
MHVYRIPAATFAEDFPSVEVDRLAKKQRRKLRKLESRVNLHAAVEGTVEKVTTTDNETKSVEIDTQNITVAGNHANINEAAVLPLDISAEVDAAISAVASASVPSFPLLSRSASKLSASSTPARKSSIILPFMRVGEHNTPALALDNGIVTQEECKAPPILPSIAIRPR